MAKKTLWLTRTENDGYELWRDEPEWRDGVHHLTGDLVLYPCTTDWERITGVVLEPNEMCQVTVDVKQVGETYVWE